MCDIVTASDEHGIIAVMVTRVMLCAPLVLVACGDDGSPPPGDASIDARPSVDSGPDAAVQCATPDECPCFSNDECPAGTRCHAADEEHVYCEPGMRGTGAAGTTCSGENDCDSALCVDGSDVMRCSKTCTENTQCPAELPRCLSAIGICARNP